MDYVFNFWFSTIAIFVMGSLAHFVYDWSKHNKIIGLFAAVNESTWEHIKIALTPTFLWALYDGFVYGYKPNYFLAKIISVLALIILIPVMFYIFRAIFKKNYYIVNIGIFYLSIVASQLLFCTIITRPTQPFIINYLSCIGLFIVFGCYMTLTLAPLKTSLFKDPINGKYGFRAHIHLLKRKKKK